MSDLTKLTDEELDAVFQRTDEHSAEGEDVLAEIARRYRTVEVRMFYSSGWRDEDVRARYDEKRLADYDVELEPVEIDGWRFYRVYGTDGPNWHGHKQ